jgi:hypothetical protein
MKRSAISPKLPILVIAAAIGSTLIALAGPPLTCHPLFIGNAKSLPWVSNNWNLTGQEDYDVRRLADDTLALLTDEMPVIVRMETLRRATLYSLKDPSEAKEFFLKLRARAFESAAKGKPDALALFDLGYFVECMKQAHMTWKKLSTGSYEPVYQPNVASGLDGLAWVEKAIAMRGTDPEMEFAAALITSYPKQKSRDVHLRRAVEGATEDTLLARNLVEHFSERGKTLAELHANVSGGN